MANANDKAARKRSNTIRLIVILVILGVMTAFGIIHQHSLGWKPAGVDALCPFGGIESLVAVIVTGRMLEKIALSSFILLIATVLAAVLFRRTFCGTVCPFGTIQELFARLGKFLFKKRFTVPGKLDRVARYLKYAVLVVFVALTIALGTLVFRPYDPWVAYQHLTSVELFTGFLAGFIVLIVSIAGSLLYDRFFCKYLCPMGAFLALINRIGIFRIRRNASTCINCHACTKVCPVNIDVESVQEVKSAECISCSRCVNACPVEDTLYISGPRKAKLKPTVMVLLTLAVFAVVIGVTSFTGEFEWKVKNITETVAVKGSFNADDIKGSDTFKAVSEASGIPKSAFVEAFAITDTEFAGTLKDWAHKPGSQFDVQAVRDFIKAKQKQ